MLLWKVYCDAMRPVAGSVIVAHQRKNVVEYEKHVIVHKIPLITALWNYNSVEKGRGVCSHAQRAMH